MTADWSAVPAPVPYANLNNPQTLNLYALVHENPATFADLDGHLAPGQLAFSDGMGVTPRMRGGNDNAYGCGATGCDSHVTVWMVRLPTGVEYFESEALGRAALAEYNAQQVATQAPRPTSPNKYKPRHLNDYEKQALSRYLPKVDLDNAIIHVGQTPKWGILPFPFPKEADAVTVNNDIYVRKSAYTPESIDFLALLGHELFHVDQYRTGVMTVTSYLREAASHGGGMENKYEAPAYRFGDAVYDHLRSTGTNWDGSLKLP